MINIAVNFNINKISPDFKDYKWLIMGEVKSGKSFTFYDMCLKLYKRANAGVILPFEDGYSALTNVPYLTCDDDNGKPKKFIEDWDDLEEIVDTLIDERFTTFKDVEMLAFDTLDIFYKLAEGETIRLHNKKYPQDKIGIDDINKAMKGFGKGKKIMIRLVNDLFKRLRLANYGVFFISQTKEKTIKAQGDQDGYQAVGSLLTEDYFKAISMDMDFIMHIKMERILKDGRTEKDFKGKSTTHKILDKTQRKLLFSSDGYYFAGSRFSSYLPQEIDLSAENLIDAVNDAFMKAGNYDEETLKRMQVERAAEKNVEAEEFVEKDKAQRETELMEEYPEMLNTMAPILTDEYKAKLTGYMKKYEVTVPGDLFKKVDPKKLKTFVDACRENIKK